jgi:hypothetical protein
VWDHASNLATLQVDGPHLNHIPFLYLALIRYNKSPFIRFSSSSVSSPFVCPHHSEFQTAGHTPNGDRMFWFRYTRIQSYVDAMIIFVDQPPNTSQEVTSKFQSPERERERKGANPHVSSSIRRLLVLSRSQDPFFCFVFSSIHHATRPPVSAQYHSFSLKASLGITFSQGISIFPKEISLFSLRKKKEISWENVVPKLALNYKIF